jgi:hypothetical protein
MMRRSTAWYSLSSLLAGLVLYLGGCADNQIGRLCLNPSTPVTNGVTFVNPAPDCPSRLCMITPKTTQAPGDSPHRMSELSICTAECNSDDDCASPFTDNARCARYVCAVPSVVPGEENFCCKKLCMCETDLAAGFNKDGNGPKLCRDPGGVAIPKFCLPPDKGGPTQTGSAPRNCPTIQPDPSSC